MAGKKGAIVVDVNAQFQLGLIGQDGLHPTELGYQRLADIFLEALKQQARSRRRPSHAEQPAALDSTRLAHSPPTLQRQPRSLVAEDEDPPACGIAAFENPRLALRSNAVTTLSGVPPTRKTPRRSTSAGRRVQASFHASKHSSSRPAGTRACRPPS